MTQNIYLSKTALQFWLFGS